MIPKTTLCSATALLLVASSCVPRPVAPATVLSCAAPCAAIREVRFPETVAVQVRAAAGSRLKNAAVTSSAAGACKSGIPVKTVDVDGQRYPEGPIALGGTHLLELRFPFTSTTEGASDAALSPPVSLDLDLHTPAGDQCLRLTVPKAPPGFWSQLSELSFRIEPRQ